MVLIAKRLAGGGVLQADDGDDVACLAVVDVDLLGCVHLEQTADALALAADGVVRVGAGIQATGVDADVGELADERIGHDLERQSGERGLLVSLAGLGLLGVGVRALDCRDVKRARQVVDDGVEQLLDALVLVGGADEDEVQLVGDDALAQSRFELLDRELLVHEDLLHELVVEIGGSLDEGGAALLCLSLELLGDGVHGLGVGHALLIGLEVPCGHGREVDDAPELVLCAHGDLRCDGVGAEAVFHGVDRVEEVSADAVVLVDERDARDVVARCLAPHGLGLRLDACDGVENGDSTVEDAQGALYLGREVDVAWGVDDLDAVALAALLPVAGGCSGGDGNAALLLLLHPVHGRSAVVNLADLVGLAGVVEDALGRGGLAGIDVGHDADVASVFKWGLLCHYLLTLPTNDNARTHGWIRPSCRRPRAS